MSTEILDTEELAERLRTSPWTVRHWRYKGIGPRGVKVGKRVLYAWPDVELWLADKAKADRHAQESITSK